MAGGATDMFVSVLIIGLVLPALTGGCPGFTLPRSGDIVRDFAPVTRWSGHFGVDVARPVAAPVRPIGAGVVTFSGTVVDNRTVTVDHGGGIRSSYSYLAGSTSRRGDQVVRSSTIGWVGIHDGREAYHLSVRIGGAYVDPWVLGRCVWRLDRALYLGEGVRPYALRRVRHPRWHLRSSPHRASRAGQRCDRAARHR